MKSENTQRTVRWKIALVILIAATILGQQAQIFYLSKQSEYAYDDAETSLKKISDLEYRVDDLEKQLGQ
ncbi:MAG: hypothetical protein ACTHLA_01725 [Asticcacaulis sp.]|uniref:hypothetical protein n=1 Tax=Asticcacaulis sp. TaxID=1872648 RepID=UPI003F7C3F68